MESQAHRFAGAFLLPAETFAADVRTPVTLDSLLLLKQRWGVSVAAMIMRLEALKIIDADEKLVLFKRSSARWGAKSEPGDDARAPEQPRLLKRTIELLSSSGVMPIESVSSYIGLAANDVEKLAGLAVLVTDPIAKSRLISLELSNIHSDVFGNFENPEVIEVPPLATH